jgi:F-type H+-transporting ATPase subunit delta
MKGTRSASRYAKALLELAIENNKLNDISADLSVFKNAHADTRDFQVFLDSPVISSDKKISIFKELFPQFDKLTSSFIDLIIKNGRESILPAIVASFDEQMKAHLGIVPVTLVSATPLDDATKKAILAKVQAQVSGTLEVVEKIDASLLGGFIVKLGDTQIDASISNQLKTLKQRLSH